MLINLTNNHSYVRESVRRPMGLLHLVGARVNDLPPQLRARMALVIRGLQLSRSTGSPKRRSHAYHQTPSIQQHYP